MKIIRELLPGVLLISPDLFEDFRGQFVKVFHAPSFLMQLGINFHVDEEFYSLSKKGVIRGMHFQLPPDAHDKIVYCIRGSVLDVVLDLRKGRNYGHFASVVLSDINQNILYIPKGVAHGFLSQADSSIMIYKTSTVHSINNDAGVLWNSFGFSWGIKDPIISQRDKGHVEFDVFGSPF